MSLVVSSSGLGLFQSCEVNPRHGFSAWRYCRGPEDWVTVSMYSTIRKYIAVYMLVCMHVCMYEGMQVCIGVCVYIYVYRYAGVYYVAAYLSIYR